MSVDAHLSFEDTWRLFASAATAALAGLRRQRHGGEGCAADACERCEDDILRAIEMIYLDQARYRDASTVNMCVVIRNRFRDTVLRRETARRGFSQRPERLVERRSVRAAVSDPMDRMLLGQLIEHLAHSGRTPPLTDANGRWVIGADLVSQLLEGLARRDRLPSSDVMPSTDDLAQRLVRCLVHLAARDRPLLDALESAAARAAVALPAEAALSSAEDPPVRSANGESVAFQAALPQLADEFGMPLVELLWAEGNPRVDVLGALRRAIEGFPVDPRLVELIDQDDEAARDIVDVVADRLIERREMLYRPYSRKRDDQAVTSVRV